MKKSYDFVKFCEGCWGNKPCDHSHRLPQGDPRFYHLADDPGNLDEFCRTCHDYVETGKYYLLNNGREVMLYIWKQDQRYFFGKLFKEPRNIELLEDAEILVLYPAICGNINLFQEAPNFAGSLYERLENRFKALQ